MKTILKLKTLILVLCLSSFLAFSQKTTKKVSFPKGSTGTTLKGVVKGYNTITYTLDLKIGQQFNVDMKTSKTGGCYFNIIAPGEQTAMFSAELNENSFKKSLEKSGTYKIEVYLMRSLARREVPVNYTLTVSATN